MAHMFHSEVVRVEQGQQVVAPEAGQCSNVSSCMAPSNIPSAVQKLPRAGRWNLPEGLCTIGDSLCPPFLRIQSHIFQSLLKMQSLAREWFCAAVAVPYHQRRPLSYAIVRSVRGSRVAPAYLRGPPAAWPERADEGWILRCRGTCLRVPG